MTTKCKHPAEAVQVTSVHFRVFQNQVPPTEPIQLQMSSNVEIWISCALCHANMPVRPQTSPKWAVRAVWRRARWDKTLAELLRLSQWGARTEGKPPAAWVSDRPPANAPSLESAKETVAPAQPPVAPVETVAQPCLF